MGKKRKVSLSIDSDLLECAGLKGIDLNDALENALRRYGCEGPLVQEARWAKWREENRAATKSFNRHIAKHGLLGGKLASSKSKHASTKQKAKST